jgi:hypothetical protein
MKLKTVGQVSLGAKSIKIIINLSEIDKRASQGQIATFYMNLEYLKQVIDGTIPATSIAQLVPKHITPVGQSSWSSQNLSSTFRPGIERWASKEFVEFWKKFFDVKRYPDDMYHTNLNLGKDISQANLVVLLEWKFAFLQSEKRKETVGRWAALYIANLSWLNELRRLKEFDDGLFDRSLEKAVEKISSIPMAVFLLHIARPAEVPIVDQHVMRAWAFILQGKISDPSKTIEECKEYRQFFYEFCKKSESGARDVDKALMAFGNFLSSVRRLTAANNMTCAT